jgi:hypothetical protein
MYPYPSNHRHCRHWMHWPLPRSPKPVYSPPSNYERHPYPTSQQSTNSSDAHMSHRHSLAPSISATSPHLPSTSSRSHFYWIIMRPRLPSHLRQPQSRNLVPKCRHSTRTTRSPHQSMDATTTSIPRSSTCTAIQPITSGPQRTPNHTTLQQ